MSEFDIPPPGMTPKYDLVRGVEQWVAKKLHREKVQLSTLDRVNWDELVLLAGAMGYRPRHPGEARILSQTLDATRLDKPMIEGG